MRRFNAPSASFSVVVAAAATATGFRSRAAGVSGTTIATAAGWPAAASAS
jgi:hypothetical protein